MGSFCIFVKKASMLEYRWYAIYTKSRWEKKVFAELEKRGYNVFLPIVKTYRQWSDRKKLVEVPMINSYIFVNVSEKEYYDVLNTLGVVCYVTFSGKAAPIPDNQIELLRLISGNSNAIQINTDEFDKGDTVKIEAGPMKDLEGEIINFKGKSSLIIRLNLLKLNIITEINAALVKKARKTSNAS